MKIKSIISFLLLAVIRIHAQIDFLDWAKSFGNSSSNAVFHIVTDSSGNLYATGYFHNTIDFDPGPGVQNLTSAGQMDIYILKLNADGDFVWVRRIGSIMDDAGEFIALTPEGNILVAGFFKGSVDFDPGAGVSTGVSNGLEDAFLMELDSGGNFIRNECWGGNSTDEALEVAVNDNGEIYLGGIFSTSADLDPGSGTDFHNSNGTTDIFILRQDSSWNFNWARCFGGSGDDYLNSMKLFLNRKLYCEGGFSSTVDFDPNSGTSMLTSWGQADAFISELDSAGNLNWVHQMGGTGPDWGYDVTVDSKGNSYSLGTFENVGDFNDGTGIDTMISQGSDDIFVCKHDSSGNFKWVKAIAGLQPQIGTSIVTDTSGNLYIGGDFYATTDFDPSLNTHFQNANGVNADAFLTKWDSTGAFEWVNTFGNTMYDGVSTLAVSDSLNIYSGGYFGLTVDFDPGPGTFNMTTSGSSAVFLTKLGQSVITAQNQIVGEREFQLFPNPSNDVITISSLHCMNDVELQLLNSQGQIVLGKRKVNGLTTDLVINGISPGIYLLELSTASKTSYLKLIIY